MKLYKSLIFIFIAVLTFDLFAQVPDPTLPQAQPILLSGGTIHIGNGTIIENGAIAFENGKITYVGSKADFNNRGETFIEHDVAGQHVYPGLIMCNSTLGLIEVDAIKATNDQRETGAYNPSVRSIIAYNTDSERIPNSRSNGILLAQIAPTGGVISGSSSVVQLDAWNWEDAIVKTDIGIHIHWPAKYRPPNRQKGETEMMPNENYDKVTQELEKYLMEAKANRAGTSQHTNLKLESMGGLFDGTSTLFLHVNKAAEIVKSVQFFQKLDVNKIVLVGASDAYYVREFIKQNKLAVILKIPHRLPSRPEENIDFPYALPGLLFKENILVTIEPSGSDAHMMMNLPFFAGTAAAYGLSQEEALELITLNPAKILGIDKRAGTLETGKDATIVVSSGDILDMKTNDVGMAFIEGRAISLDNKHKRLYKKFMGKYN